MYEFFNSLSEQMINSEENEYSLQLQITEVANAINLKTIWFNSTSSLLHGNNYQADFGSDQMLYHLREKLDLNKWCVKKEMTLQYPVMSKKLFVQTRLRHDLLIFNLQCQDAASALLSSTGYM